MAYASIGDLQELIAPFPLSTVTEPTLAQATLITEDIGNEIDVALSASGVAVPVTTPAYFLAWLGRLNGYGAAAAVLKSMFPDSIGPGDTATYTFWNEWYQRGLAGIRDGSLIPGGVVADGDFVLPSTYLTRNPDSDEDLGDIAEPMFGIRKAF